MASRDLENDTRCEMYAVEVTRSDLRYLESISDFYLSHGV
jgi:hypothetical protein